MDVLTRGRWFWQGKDWREALATLETALRAGMTPGRALSLGHVASWADNWTFARHLAERAGVSLRTFQRAIAQAKSLGMLETWRGKKREKPPKSKHEVPCGWCHRVIVGRGLSPQARVPLVARARLTWNVRLSRRQQKPVELVALAEQRTRLQPRKPPPGANPLDWLNQQLEALNAKPPRAGPEE